MPIRLSKQAVSNIRKGIQTGRCGWYLRRRIDHTMNHESTATRLFGIRNCGSGLQVKTHHYGWVPCADGDLIHSDATTYTCGVAN